MITKEMIKQKKKEIVQAEQGVLKQELEQYNKDQEEHQKDAQKEEKSGLKLSPAEQLTLDQKKKIAEAVKAVIKTDREEQARLEAARVICTSTFSAERRGGRQRERQGECGGGFS